MKNIILCADDYGQNPAISQAILHLIKDQRLSAVSCMVNSIYWREHARWLIPYQDRIDIGLHFNLTDGKLLSEIGQAFSLRALMQKTMFKLVNRKKVEAELHAQIDQFVAQMNRLPDFIDGHQHVHIFPVIREVLVKVYAKRLRNKKAYIRSLSSPDTLLNVKHPAYFKKVILRLLGSKIFSKRLKFNHIPTNSSFSGMYNFGGKEDYSLIFPNFLNEIEDKGLIMCHPGLDLGWHEDPISISRYKEFQYLISGNFLMDCEKYKIQLSRFYEHESA